MPRPAFLIQSVAATLIATMIVSCDSTDPGMAEKVALMEAEIREKDRLMESMSAELSSRSTVSNAPATPNIEAARNSYLRYVDQLRDKIAQAMPDMTFDSDRVSVFPVVGPDPSLPIASKAGFYVTTADGNRGELVVPFQADFSGNWKDPDIEKIVKAFQVPQSAPVKQAANPQAGSPPASTPPRDVMGAERTIEVQWGDEAPQQSPPQSSNQGQPSPPSSPSQPKIPQRVMPTDRDVIIEFD